MTRETVSHAREAISHINFRRIEWCCRDANTSLEVLCSALKIPLAKLQQGPLTYNQLKKVAKHFGYSPLFFLEKGLPQSESIHSPAFRTLADQSADQSVRMDTKLNKLIKQVEWHRDIYISLQEDLEEPTSFQPPRLSGNIEQKSAIVREWLGLSTNSRYDFADYRELIESKGILVFKSMGYNGPWQFKNENVAGFLIQHPKVPAIFIRKTSYPMQTFTLFHELGHLLLHDTSCFDSEQNLASNTSRRIEREANQFAGDCLVPPSLLKDIWIPKNPEQYRSAFSAIAKNLGVSVEAILVSLQQQNDITWDDYSAWKKWEVRQSNNGEIVEYEKPKIPRTYRYREPGKIFGDRYVGTVLSAHHSGLVTINKASDYLDHLKLSDIKKLDVSL